MKHFKELFRGTKKISSERSAALLAFCKPLGLKFRDLELLDLAFHHRSFSNESRQYKRFNNERLEFLGDSVLGLAAAAFLYEDMAQNPEGDLAKIKAAVVSEKALAPVAIEYGVDKMLVMGKGEEKSGGRTKPAILADCMEAIIGAYYLDSGYEESEKYILRFIIPAVRSVQENKSGADYKSLLQEKCQKEFKCVPRYELVKAEGPDHDRVFCMQASLGGRVYGPARGKNKKQAEQEAARIALRALGVVD